MLNYSFKKINTIFYFFVAFCMIAQAGLSQTAKRNPLLPAFNQQIDFQSVTAEDIKEARKKTIATARGALEKNICYTQGKAQF